MKNDTVFVLLAGGMSERMGIAKGLLEYKNSYWILEQINQITESAITEIYIGLGYHFEEYLNKIPLLKAAQFESVSHERINIRVIVNKNPALGSFSTLQTVLEHIPENKSVLINPIDIPIINKTGLETIIAAQNTIVLPQYKGKNGHPIKLHPDFWKTLLLLDPTDKNSRLDLEIKKMTSSDITTVEVTDSCILKNLNTPQDWLEYLNIL